MSGDRIPTRSEQTLAALMAEYYADVRAAGPSGRKVAWVTACTPVELLYAADVVPFYPENHAALCGARKVADTLCEAAEARGFSRGICSYARVDFGNLYTGRGPFGRFPKPDFLVCESHCGAVTKWYQQLQRELGVPLLYLDTPRFPGEPPSHAIEYVRTQLETLMAATVDITGKPIDPGKLRTICRFGAQAVRLWSGLVDLLAHKPAPMTSFDTFVHMAPIVTLRGTPQCVEYYRQLTDEVRERIAQDIAAVPGERFRLGWDNVPIWHALRGLSKHFSAHKACLAAATSIDWALMADPDSPVDLLDQFARAALRLRGNLEIDTRIETLSAMVRKFSLDGIVMHSNRSCRPLSLGQFDVSRILQESFDLPVLILEGDMCDPRAWAEEQVHARIDSFMEVIEQRKIC